MSNNELYEHRRSDTVKWVLTLFAFILVGVMLAGIILGWFDKKEEPPAEEEQTEQAAVMDGQGNAMDEDIVYPLPEKMSFSAASFVEPLAQFGEPTGTVTTEQSVEVRIQAYVTPDDAVNKEVDFSVAWGNATTHGSELVTNYLTVTPDSDGSTTGYRVLQKVVRRRHHHYYRHHPRGRIYGYLHGDVHGYCERHRDHEQHRDKEVHVRARRILRTRHKQDVHLQYRAHERL